jgi:tetratricopeptide (TPR) repeat protein
MPEAGDREGQGSVSTEETMFAEGIAHQQAGRLAEADSWYGEVLRLDPRHLGALELSGVIAAETGRPAVAIDRFRRLLRIKPDYPEIINNIGIVLQQQGRLPEAIDHYHQALDLKPDFPEALNNLGQALCQAGRPDEAIGRFEQALGIRPDDADALNNLGVVFKNRGAFTDAADRFEQALGLRPDHRDALSNLGDVHRELGQVGAAIDCYRQALRLQPDDAGTLNNLGLLLVDFGDLGEAIDCYRRALGLRPAFPEALHNLGIARQRQGELTEAVALFKQAQRLKPDFADAHWSEGLIQLLTGDLGAGWLKFEWRWLRRGASPHGHRQPAWDGSRLDGKTILLHCEQGFGDTIQFIRYARVVKDKGGTVVVFCPAPLLRLLRNVAGIDVLVSERDSIPPCDCQAALLSLPMLFGTTIRTIPAGIPYLHADADPVTRWRERLAPLDGIRIGLVWAGDPRPHDLAANGMDLRRSLRLEQFAPLAGLSGVRFISLQKGQPAGQARHPPPGFALIDWTAELNDFADTAALVASLDLIISVDTSVAHLAGALGRPVWLLSRFDGCWRWLTNRDDSPWYPTLRLFRQPQAGDWGAVLDQLHRELRLLTGCGGDREGEGGGTVGTSTWLSRLARILWPVRVGVSGAGSKG